MPLRKSCPVLVVLQSASLDREGTGGQQQVLLPHCRTVLAVLLAFLLGAFLLLFLSPSLSTPRGRSGPFKRGGDAVGGHIWPHICLPRTLPVPVPVPHGSDRRPAQPDAGPGSRRGGARLSALHRLEALLPRLRARGHLGRLVGTGAAGAAGARPGWQRGKGGRGRSSGAVLRRDPHWDGEKARLGVGAPSSWC